MKQERHPICRACYAEMIPNAPHTDSPAPGHPEEPCCRCGAATADAIYLMARPTFECKVVHE